MSRLILRYRQGVYVAAGVLIFLVAYMIGRPRPVAQPAPTPGQNTAALPNRAPVHHHPVVMGFYEPAHTTGLGQGSKPTLTTQYRHISIVSPFWYSVDAAGGLKNPEAPDVSVTSFAHRHGIVVMPLVSNLGSGMLAYGAQPAVENNLVHLVSSQAYDGLVIDFELIPPSTRDELSTFVHDLAAKLHKRHKLLAVTVFPKVGVSPQIQSAYDYGALGANADYVVLMAYDHHQNSSSAGPVAPLAWVKANVRDALGYVPPAKLLLSIGQYGYDWTAPGSAKTVTAVQAIALARRQGVPIKWSSSYGEAYFTYTSAGTPHVVWFDNALSFKQRFDLAKSSGMAGIGLWRLHFGQPSIWSMVGTAARLRG